MQDRIVTGHLLAVLVDVQDSGKRLRLKVPIDVSLKARCHGVRYDGRGHLSPPEPSDHLADELLHGHHPLEGAAALDAVEVGLVR